MGRAVVVALLLAACSSDSVVPRQTVALEDWATRHVVLEEDGDDPIGLIGELYEVEQSFDVLISDQLNQQVRLYSRNGSHLGSFGSLGDGPGEFQRITSMASTPEGGFAVADPRSGRISYFDRDLQYDTTHRSMAFELVALSEDTILIGSTVGPRLQMWSLSQSFLWGAFPQPIPTQVNPYWNGLGGVQMAAAGDSIFVIHGLLYPMAVYDARTGDSLGTFGTPSSSYREVTVVPAGTFAGSKQIGPEIQEWLGSFDVVERLDVVGSRLVVTHATNTRVPSGFEQSHNTIDVYDLGLGGEKIWEDIELPEGAKVLGGGSYLYVLLSDLPPWRIAVLSIPPSN